MRINFFEEFPETGSLEKARLVDFPSTVYIAARSFEAFTRWKELLWRINPRMEAAYWPVLEKSYWVSPVAFHNELTALTEDLASNRGKHSLKVLIDLELPLKKNFHMENIPSFSKNRKTIKSIFSSAAANNIEILTAEYPSSNRFMQLLWKALGLSYDRNKYPHQRIIMYYSSMIRGAKRDREWLVGFIRKFIGRALRKNGDLQIGLGTIDVGVLGNEPILSPEDLNADLVFLKERGVKTAVIFRLSGMNEQYRDTLRPYAE